MPTQRKQQKDVVARLSESGEEVPMAPKESVAWNISPVVVPAARGVPEMTPRAITKFAGSVPPV